MMNTLTHHTTMLIISLASYLWDISKQYSPRCDAAERGVPSGAALNCLLKEISLKNGIRVKFMKVDYPNDKNGQLHLS